MESKNFFRSAETLSNLTFTIRLIQMQCSLLHINTVFSATYSITWLKDEAFLFFGEFPVKPNNSIEIVKKQNGNILNFPSFKPSNVGNYTCMLQTTIIPAPNISYTVMIKGTLHWWTGLTLQAIFRKKC